MKSYLVGGAVRDQLLGLPVKDRDYVVVGSSVDDMLAAGFTPVGQDFPVFLHPATKDEYALARTERKTAKGYKGFVFHTAHDVTIEQDLARRDLTINAMAMEDNGDIIDPYGGQQDLSDRVLRHVTDAFAEDPVRVLRVARFHARLADHGFSVAPETLALMRSLVDQGELETLVAERVWAETLQALMTGFGSVYFKTLRACGALRVIFPEIDALYGVPQPAQWHPEIDTAVHTFMVLDQASALSDSGAVRFAALCHDVGKGTTPSALWPKHHGHESAGVPLVKSLCHRLKVPSDCTALALLSCEYHGHCHKVLELKPSTLATLLASLDVQRRPERFEQFLTVCLADARGRLGFEDRAYPQAEYLRGAADAYRAVDAAHIAQTITDKTEPAESNQGEAIRTAIHMARIAALKTYKNTTPINSK